ncbi:MAG TPA: beta-ketoacyl synthase chain length factor [Candidatus Competibacteraceae bacterium]|nr:beta-ketoacyl synthase chain length factor [Candidatus Competibacteraceae bacterium]
MSALFVEGVSILAPGLIGWNASRAVLTGERPYHAAALPPLTANLLPANERRRVTALVKLALHLAQEAVAMADCDPRTVCTVFASSGGDSEVLDQICAALTLPDRPVSPTYFHQSVHNTPAGYWAIATGCARASTSLSAYDGSVAAGLLEAAALALTEATPVLLVACDLPPPFPLLEHRPLTAPFGMALLLNPTATAPRLATLQVRPVGHRAPTTLADPDLEALRRGNPAARALPLLQTIACATSGRIILADEGEIAVNVDIEP